MWTCKAWCGRKPTRIALLSVPTACPECSPWKTTCKWNSQTGDDRNHQQKRSPTRLRFLLPGSSHALGIAPVIALKNREQLGKRDLQCIGGDRNRAAGHLVIRAVRHALQRIATLDVNLGIFDFDDQRLLVEHLKDLGAHDLAPGNKPGGDAAGIVDDAGAVQDQTRFFGEHLAQPY